MGAGSLIVPSDQALQQGCESRFVGTFDSLSALLGVATRLLLT